MRSGSSTENGWWANTSKRAGDGHADGLSVGGRPRQKNDCQKRTGGIRPTPSGSPIGAVPAVSTTPSGCQAWMAASKATSMRR